MPEAAAFLTQVLDFQLVRVWPEDRPFYAILKRGADEMHLSLASGSGLHGPCSVIITCDDVDLLFAAFEERGLKISNRPDSPVHNGPVDQSWGTREVYLDDPSGNTLIFQQR